MVRHPLHNGKRLLGSGFFPYVRFFRRDAVAQAGTEDDEYIAGVKEYKRNDVWLMLTAQEVFFHVWFLWFLCLLLPFFLIYAAVSDRWKCKGLPRRLILSPYRYLWLISLTMIPQWFMSAHGSVPGFGPDVFTVTLPPAYILFYYGIFFSSACFTTIAKIVSER